MPIKGDMLQFLNCKWLAKVTGSHGVRYRYGSRENWQYVIFLLFPFPPSLKNATLKR